MPAQNVFDFLSPSGGRVDPPGGGFNDVVGGVIIGASRLVSINTSTGALEQSAANDFNVIGLSCEPSVKVSGDLIKVGWGFREVRVDGPVAAGVALKAGVNGKVTQLVTAAVVGTSIGQATGLQFTNQPTNDSVTIVSDSASDVQSVTLYGTTNGGNTVVVETIVLTGVTPVITTKTDWGEILGIELSAAAVGTITFTETSAAQTITTIAPAATAKGVYDVPAATQNAFCVKPTIVAGGASTKKVGLVGTGTIGTALTNNAAALNGATPVTMPTAMNLVTKILLGDVATATTVTVKVGAEDDKLLKVGKSVTAATATDALISAVISL